MLKEEPPQDESARARLKLPSGIETQTLFGNFDNNLKRIEEALKVRLTARGNEIFFQGGAEPVRQARGLMEALVGLLSEGYGLRSDDLEYALNTLQRDPSVSIEELFRDSVSVATKKRMVVPRTQGQNAYLDAVRKHDLTIAIGPAGTGKTYLAMALAVSALS
ncbi:MAG TPA: PhoH family protein, partial [Nitrospiria bacterium]|nr:PhoH family protein [Nitrospiria bacterium]